MSTILIFNKKSCLCIYVIKSYLLSYFLVCITSVLQSAWNSSCKSVVLMLNEAFDWLPECLEDNVEVSQIDKKRKNCEQAYKSLLEKFNLREFILYFCRI